MIQRSGYSQLVDHKFTGHQYIQQNIRGKTRNLLKYYSADVKLNLLLL